MSEKSLKYKNFNTTSYYKKNGNKLIKNNNKIIKKEKKLTN